MFFFYRLRPDATCESRPSQDNTGLFGRQSIKNDKSTRKFVVNVIREQCESDISLQQLLQRRTRDFHTHCRAFGTGTVTAGLNQTFNKACLIKGDNIFFTDKHHLIL